MINQVKRPATAAERVKRAEDKAIAAGARQTPRGLLSPDAAQALDDLQRSGYAGSATGCISRALVDSALKLRNEKDHQ